MLNIVTITLIIITNKQTIRYNDVFVNRDDKNTDVPILANTAPNDNKNNIIPFVLITVLDQIIYLENINITASTTTAIQKKYIIFVNQYERSFTPFKYIYLLMPECLS